MVDDVSLCFSGWLFGNEAVSFSFLALSLLSGTDCKNVILNYLLNHLREIVYLAFVLYVTVLFRK